MFFWGLNILQYSFTVISAFKMLQRLNFTVVLSAECWLKSDAVASLSTLMPRVLY